MKTGVDKVPLSARKIFWSDLACFLCDVAQSEQERMVSSPVVGPVWGHWTNHCYQNLFDLLVVSSGLVENESFQGHES